MRLALLWRIHLQVAFGCRVSGFGVSLFRLYKALGSSAVFFTAVP